MWGQRILNKKDNKQCTFQESHNTNEDSGVLKELEESRNNTSNGNNQDKHGKEVIILKVELYAKIH